MVYSSYYLLPITYYLLPITYYLLPITVPLPAAGGHVAHALTLVSERSALVVREVLPATPLAVRLGLGRVGLGRVGRRGVDESGTTVFAGSCQSEHHELVVSAVGEPTDRNRRRHCCFESVIGGANREVDDEVVEKVAATEVGRGPGEVDHSVAAHCCGDGGSDRAERDCSDLVGRSAFREIYERPSSRNPAAGAYFVFILLTVGEAGIAMRQGSGAVDDDWGPERAADRASIQVISADLFRDGAPLWSGPRKVDLAAADIDEHEVGCGLGLDRTDVAHVVAGVATGIAEDVGIDWGAVDRVE